MKLSFNIADVPDKVPPIEAGEYYGNIDSIDFQDAKGKRDAGYNCVIKVSEGPHIGRKLSDFFDAADLGDSKSMSSVRFKKLLLSAGLSNNLNEVDTDELKGKSVHFTVKQTNGKDAAGNATTYANVDQYLYKATA